MSKLKSNPFCWDCKIQHCVIKLHEKESKLQRALIEKLEDKIKILEIEKKKSSNNVMHCHVYLAKEMQEFFYLD